MKRSWNDEDLRCERCGGYWNDCPCDRSRFNLWGLLYLLMLAGIAALMWVLS